MIKIQNNSTGEVFVVNDVRWSGDQVVSEKGTKGARFIEKHAGVLEAHTAEDGAQYFTLRDGFSPVRGRSTEKAEKPRAKAEKEAKVETKAETTTDADEKPAAKAPAKSAGRTATKKGVEKAHEEAKAKADTDENEKALIDALKRLRGGNVDAEAVRAIIAEELAKYATDEPEATRRAALKVRRADEKEVYCEKFERIVAKVSRGNNVYLYGRAGSGKSHTAEQVARRLGLKFYGQTTIQFAHDVRGYGDAGGNFQETPFFKAFANGGLYFQDEYDRSFPEAAVVLNSALANGWYDFPVVGRVNAHPDFRFMAAGNTLMKGADEEYVTGQTQDASCRDRFGFFFEVDYNHEVEMHVAHGHEDIVAFVEDVRQAVRACGLQHVVSYRATAAMADEVEHENDIKACCEECVFKGLERDAIREIFGQLKDKTNVWAKATAKLF